jgi:hypothetical protein
MSDQENLKEAQDSNDTQNYVPKVINSIDPIVASGPIVTTETVTENLKTLSVKDLTDSEVINLFFLMLSFVKLKYFTRYFNLFMKMSIGNERNAMINILRNLLWKQPKKITNFGILRS